jgi:hypothetical protein
MAIPCQARRDISHESVEQMKPSSDIEQLPVRS